MYSLEASSNSDVVGQGDRQGGALDSRTPRSGRRSNRDVAGLLACYADDSVSVITLRDGLTISDHCSFDNSTILRQMRLVPGGCVGRFPVLDVDGTLNGVDLKTSVHDAASKPRPARTATTEA